MRGMFRAFCIYFGNNPIIVEQLQSGNKVYEKEGCGFKFEREGVQSFQNLIGKVGACHREPLHALTLASQSGCIDCCSRSAPSQ